MQKEFGAAYVRKVREHIPEVSGLADFCVYWFRKAHIALPANCRAGLVGTKTIRETNSRTGGLDYIVNNGGTITEAVSRQVWSGDAAVDVSIVNWVKGKQKGKKNLYLQVGSKTDSPWEVREVEHIHSGLSFELDVSTAVDIRANATPKTFFQGVTPGHKGYLVTPDEAKALTLSSKKDGDIIFPYLIGEDLIDRYPGRPRRCIVDFGSRDMLAASEYSEPLKIIRENVLDARQKALREETARNEEVFEDNPGGEVNRHHQNFLSKWWLLSYRRSDLISIIESLPRYIVCVRTTMRPIFEFIDPSIRPGDALQVFTFADDYSFGILQSPIHWKWFTERCSKLSARFRYTSQTVYSTFPWPQSPTLGQIKKVAQSAVFLRSLRQQVMAKNEWSLRDIYRTTELPGKNALKSAHENLDKAVRAAYGMTPKEDSLAFLLELNEELATKEASMQPVTGPGLPSIVKDEKYFITSDRLI